MDLDLVEQIRNAYAMHRPDRALYNAATNNDLKRLALNRDLIRRHEDIYTHRIDSKGVTNQEQSGRCWAFAALNVLRPAVVAKHKLDKFEFSQNYIAFWDKLEKANYFLDQILALADRDLLDRDMERLLRSPFHEGGWWNYVAGLIQKYGAVPLDAMPETYSSKNSAHMQRMIATMLRVTAAELRRQHAAGASDDVLQALKVRTLGDVHRVLVLNLGDPPREFSWRYKNKENVVSAPQSYTPRTFYDEFVGVDMFDYVALYHDPTQPFGKHYSLQRSRNMSSGQDMSYANVDIDVLRNAAQASLLDNQPCWFAADVHKDQSQEHGVMADKLFDLETAYDINLTMNKADRVLYREGASNHAMTLLGVDIVDNRPRKWLVENSWGNKKGAEGYWAMYDDWFSEHVYNVIVLKRFVSEETLEIYDQTPIELPPWYPNAPRLLGE